jgi:hypothetical protein
MTKNTIEKTEIINVKALKWVINNFKNININRKCSQSLENIKYGEDTTVDQLKRLLNECQKNGKHKTTYTQAGYKNIGRFYVRGVGLANIMREIRSVIARDNYMDIDIVNCDPTLTIQFCNLNLPNVGITNLKCYAENRDSQLSDLMEKNNITKEQAKDIILSISKGGNLAYDKLKNKPEWLTKLKSEFEAIGKGIISLYPDKADECRKKKPAPKCLWGAVYSTVIQSIENDIIQCLDKFLTDKGFNVDVLIFDGVLVQKTKKLTNDILNEASEHIKNDVGYKVTFLIKKFDEVITIPEEMLTVDEEYEIIKKEFEKNMCKIINPPQYLNLKEFNKPHSFTENERHEITYLNKKQIMEAYEDFNEWKGTTIYGGKSPKSFIDNWVKDPNKNSYEKIDFLPYPLKCPATTFNLFKGFDIERVEGAKYNKMYVDLFREHLSYLVDYKKDCADFLEKWFASIIQFPSVKSQVMICLKSSEGCGKNILLDIMASIIGHKYYLTTSDPAEDLFSKFNSCITNKLLINLDESQQSDTKKFYEQLKARITNPFIQIQPKGKDIFTINDFSNNFSTSNNDITFKISNKDRRFALFECTQEKKDEDYYNKLFDMKTNKDALYSIYTYLKSIEVEKYNFQRNRPITEYYKRCMEYFTCNIYEYFNQLFFDDINDDGENIIEDNGTGTWKYRASELYNNYLEFCKQQKYINLTNSTFGAITNQILKRVTVDGKRYYILDKKELKNYLVKNNYWNETGCLIDDDKETTEITETSDEEDENEEVIFLPVIKKQKNNDNYDISFC